jgi:8-oxo-dGTP pyrophosphatase MutT (NUDIX family)
MKQFKKDDIIHALKQNLPGGKAHTTMLPEGRPLLVPGNNNRVKKSAVLVSLFETKGKLHFCLTRRSKKLKHHPGQISFPGGRQDKSDTSVQYTALREMEEETGISPSGIEIIGNLSEIYIPVSNFIIYPVVGFMNNTKPFRANTHEVEEIIALPVSDFLIEKHLMVETFITTSGRTPSPCYKINGYTIWGATAMIIAEFSLLLKQHLARREAYYGNVGNGR